MSDADGLTAQELAPTVTPAPTILSVTHVSKHFGGVVALQDVSLTLHRGTVTALIGENGAGKSTLINIISGAFPPDAGSVKFDGVSLALGHPHQTLRSGIAAVHQELTLFPHLTVWENIFTGHELTGRLSRQLRSAEMIAKASGFLGQLGADIDPGLIVQQLSLAQQHLVEIAKALSWSPSLLILDEATSALDAHQVDRVFDLVKTLKAQGVAVVFVSHRMGEAMTIADRAIVLKDARLAAEFDTLQGVGEADLIEKMIGRSLSAIFPGKATHTGDPVLQVQGMTGGLLHDVSLDIRAGEIVGLGGLQGHGQAEVLRAIFGDLAFSGTVLVHGHAVAMRSPMQAIDRGIAYIPPDRKTEGLFLPQSVEFNLTISRLRRILSTALGILRFRREQRVVHDIRLQMDIRQREWQQAVESLSGGNQQKVMLGRWLGTGFRVLLLDEPTRGVDVGTKGELYRLLRWLAGQGTGVLIASTDSIELLGLCDRVYVLYEGGIQAELVGEHLTEYELTRATMGAAVPAESAP